MKKFKSLPSSIRMFIACGLFLIILAGVVVALFEPQKSYGLLPSETRALNPADDVVFYKNIGVSPRNLSKAKPTDGSGPTQFTVEIAKVRTKKEAEKVIHDLDQVGVEAFFTPLHQDGHVFFRIRSGVFPSQDLATRQAENLRDNHSLKTKVTKL